MTDKKTHHLENPGGTDGKWLEPMRDFLTLAHQASYVASAGSAEDKANYVKKICSNRRLAYASLSYSYSYPYKILAEGRGLKLGSLSYEPRGNLSLYTGMYYSGFIARNKQILDFREVYSSPICPFCPVIFGIKQRNSLTDKEIKMSSAIRADISTF